MRKNKDVQVAGVNNLDHDGLQMLAMDTMKTELHMQGQRDELHLSRIHCEQRTQGEALSLLGPYISTPGT